MIKLKNKQDLAKGPPGLIARRSRDSLWAFGVRGDPPDQSQKVEVRRQKAEVERQKLKGRSLILEASLPEREAVEGERQKAEGEACEWRHYPLLPIKNRDRLSALADGSLIQQYLIFREIAGCERPDGRGMPRRVPVMGNAVRSKKTLTGLKRPDMGKMTCQRAQLLTESREPVYNKLDLIVMKKDGVRVDLFPEGSPMDGDMQGFPRARGAMSSIPLPEGNGKGYCSDENGGIQWQLRYSLLPIKNRDRLSALADGSGDAVVWQQMEYNKLGLNPKWFGNLYPLPEGNGKGYCPDENGGIQWQLRYSLPSALADGSKGVVLFQKEGRSLEAGGRSLKRQKSECEHLYIKMIEMDLKKAKQNMVMYGQSPPPSEGLGEAFEKEGRRQKFEGRSLVSECFQFLLEAESIPLSPDWLYITLNLNEKDCVRVDLFPEGSPKDRSTHGFHRAPRAMGDINPLPEGNGKGYCPAENGSIRWQEYYPLPSALADGSGDAVVCQQMEYNKLWLKPKWFGNLYPLPEGNGKACLTARQGYCPDEKGEAKAPF